MLKNIAIIVLAGALMASWTPTVIDRLYEPPIRYEANVILAQQFSETATSTTASSSVATLSASTTETTQSDSEPVDQESDFAETITSLIAETETHPEPTLVSAPTQTETPTTTEETETAEPDDVVSDELVIFEITQAQHFRQFQVFANKPIDIKKTTFTIEEPALTIAGDYSAVEPYNQTTFRCRHDKLCLAYEGTAQEETYLYRLFDGGVDLLGQALRVKIKLTSIDGDEWESDWLTYTLNDADDRLHFELPEGEAIEYYERTEQLDKVSEYVRRF